MRIQYKNLIMPALIVALISGFFAAPIFVEERGIWSNAAIAEASTETKNWWPKLWKHFVFYFVEGDDIDITVGNDPKSITFAVEDDIDISALRASTASGLGIYDVDSNLGIFVEDGGNVGIGATTPVGPLHIHADTGNSGETLSIQSKTDNRPGIQLWNNNQTEGGAVFFSDDMQVFTGAGDLILTGGDSGIAGEGIIFKTWTSNNTFERVRIDTNGNVGIGTSNPARKLEVSGAIKLGDEGTKPVCDATARGTIWLDYGGSGEKDAAEICMKDAADIYAWHVIY